MGEVNGLSVNTESTQLRTASWLLILIGGINVIASNGYAISYYFMMFQIIPMQPPEYVPIWLLSMQLMLIYIVANITLGTLILIAALVALKKNLMVGGIFAIIFSVVLFVSSGFFAWVGAIFAIVGGIFCIIIARSKPKSPEPEII